jgi:hypothetical protein
MSDLLRRVRCCTKKCRGFLDAKVSALPKTADSSWQFYCSMCGYWNLASNGGVKATSREEFDLERLAPGLRRLLILTREPPGGV